MTTDEPNLTHLDDPMPPAFDDDAWRRIERRSREIARRRRFAVGTTSASALAALVIVAIAWSVIGHSEGGGIATVGSSTSGASTSLDAAVWVTVALHVDQATVDQGHTVTGTVVFDNVLARRVALPEDRPTPWQVVVNSGTARPSVAWPGAATTSHVLDLAPGFTTVAFSASTAARLGACLRDALVGCRPLLGPGPASVWFVTEAAVEHVRVPDPAPITISGRGSRPPEPKPCPVPSPEPSDATGRYCGPTPTAGNGLGPNGECTGRETGPPCGAGAVPGRYYAFTLPGTCDGRIVFDGRHWISELPPPSPVPDMDVWMRLDRNGRLGFISPAGSVGFDPDAGQAAKACATS